MGGESFANFLDISNILFKLIFFGNNISYHVNKRSLNKNNSKKWKLSITDKTMAKHFPPF